MCHRRKPPKARYVHKKHAFGTHDTGDKFRNRPGKEGPLLATEERCTCVRERAEGLDKEGKVEGLRVGALREATLFGGFSALQSEAEAWKERGRERQDTDAGMEVRRALRARAARVGGKRG
eukprot:2227126-Pleurochrysis_carterae.AAC.3